ncbi:MAG TPA: ABC transporter permease, partial [Rhodanobacteraceae bacterium]
MSGFLPDLRFALRMLAAKPAHTLSIVLTLALAIAANAAIFSVVEAVLLRPLPYPDAARTAVMWATQPDHRRVLVAYSDVAEWRARAKAFETIGVVRGQSVNLTGRGAPERLGGQFVGAETFAVLGARVVLGRLFTVEESTPGHGADVVVLAHEAWTNRFGADPGIIGQTLLLNARPRVVIGVLAPGFESPFGPTDVWLPITSIPTPQTFDRGYANVWAVGRLKPGATLREAQAELDVIEAELATAYPETNAGIGAAVLSLRDQVVGDVRPALLTIFAAVVLVLLIACANIANLQLVRGAARSREMSLRAVLGAERGRLIRQLLTENLLVCGIAGVGGIVMAMFAVPALAGAIRDTVPVFGPIDIDGRVVAFSIALTVLTSVLSGVSPAYQISRTRLGALG